MLVYILEVSKTQWMVIYTHNNATIAILGSSAEAFAYCKANSLYVTEVKIYAS